MSGGKGGGENNETREVSRGQITADFPSQELEF